VKTLNRGTPLARALKPANNADSPTQFFVEVLNPRILPKALPNVFKLNRAESFYDRRLSLLRSFEEIFSQYWKERSILRFPVQNWVSLNSISGRSLPLRWSHFLPIYSPIGVPLQTASSMLKILHFAHCASHSNLPSLTG
jgi:hypothetical protein